jgi:NADH-quinone oxidoreductase subunit C
VGNVLLEQGLSFTPLGNDARGFEMLEVPAEAWPGVAEILRDDVACRFDLLVSVSGVDWKTHRQAVYHLYSTETFQWLVVKVNAVTHGETERVPSVTPVWPAADWHERETYDLFGLHFDGHPNHQRILMPNDWLGHPLRKDYKEVDPRLVWNRR